MPEEGRCEETDYTPLYKLYTTQQHTHTHAHNADHTELRTIPIGAAESGEGVLIGKLLVLAGDEQTDLDALAKLAMRRRELDRVCRV